MITRMDVVKELDAQPTEDDFREELIRGLSQQPKRIPCKFLYDAEGSRLFEQICGLEEYYPTRTEMRLLKDHVREIRLLCGTDCLLVELGSGSSTKTRLLLDNLPAPASYVPIDISGAQLAEAAASLDADYPSLEIVPLCADYTKPLQLPHRIGREGRTLVFFPGSTIGNFEKGDAIEFLKQTARLCGRNGALLIGVDLQKPADVLERAYNDSEGVTAAFDLNLLIRANRELGAGFALDQFRHRAVFDRVASRIEMRLESLSAQRVCLEREFRFEPGEPIITEHSYKYDLESFRNLAARAGLQVRRIWTDPRRWFSLWLLAPGGHC